MAALADHYSSNVELNRGEPHMTDKTLTIRPADLADLAGLVLFAGVVILQFVLRRRAPSAA